MDMNCSSCGNPLKEGEPHCAQDHATMTCEADMCTCPTCGNKVAAGEIKCDQCLGM